MGNAPCDLQIAVNWRFLVNDELWEAVAHLLPSSPKGKRGRPRMDSRKAFGAVYYILRTGIQWKALPRCLGASSTVHDRFQEWAKAGVFERLWHAGLEYDASKGIDWRWQALDGAMTKAPLGGEGTGKNPTDRTKSGTKRSLLTDGKGIPLSVVVGGANDHDKTLVAETFECMTVDRPSPQDVERNACLDKGYDFGIRELVASYGYTAHIPHRGEVARRQHLPGYRARRWVMERTHSWMNRFRRLLVR